MVAFCISFFTSQSPSCFTFLCLRQLHGRTHADGDWTALSSASSSHAVATDANVDCNDDAADADMRADASAAAAAASRAVVLVSHMEHHSNLLPWRECPGVDVVTVKSLPCGRLDQADLKVQLVAFAKR